MSLKRSKLLAICVGMAAMHLGHAADVSPSSEPSFDGRVGIDTKSVPKWPQPVRAPHEAPNIVIILLDDAGFADAGSFGGLIDTPAFDRLASSGLRYSRFHVTAVCAPTRAALLSGRNHHRVGFGSIPEMPSGFPGYDSVWKKNAVSIAEVLRRNGYSTAAFGKWHNTPKWEITPVGPFDRWPTGLGFEYFYGFNWGMASQWEPPLYRNTLPVDPPKTSGQGYHFTTDITDDAIRWVQTHESLAPGKPYFLYFAPGATHDPHHVGKEWIEKYRGKFDRGWDVLRKEIFARQKRLGIIPVNAELTPRPRQLPAWRSLDAQTRKLLVRQMEVYAGFRAQTDYEIGRLLEAIRYSPEYENTLVMYIASDNGGSALSGPTGHEDMWANKTSMESQLSRIDELGGAKHLNSYAAGWGWMSNAPFPWGKLAASHLGGIRAPLVVSWPRRIRAHGEVRTQFTHINAIAATVYEVSGITFPNRVDGIEQLPLDGPSFAYTFDQPEAPSIHRVQYFENWENRAIYQDGWLASLLVTSPLSLGAPMTVSGQASWELYHIEEDFSQAHDLAKEHPDKLRVLQALFEKEARENDVYPIGATFAFRDQVPSLNENQKHFVYHPGLLRLPSHVAPDFTQSHRITVEAEIRSSEDEGVLISNGNRFGGFVLYIKDNRLVYESARVGGKPDTIFSSHTVPSGQVKLVYEFAAEDGSDSASANSVHVGTGRLYINDEKVGESSLLHPPRAILGSFSIGRAAISPVSMAYELPFKFTGALKSVTVDIEPK